MISRKLLSENVAVRSSESSDEYSISSYGYGKDYVKILHVKRDGLVHTVNEFEVSTHLKLASKKDWFKGMSHFFLISKKFPRNLQKI